MPQVVPAEPSDPSQRFSTTLSGTQVIMDLRWNQREEAWYLDVYAEDDETPIARGLKIVTSWPLGRRATDDRMPVGVLMAVDTLGDEAEATLDTLGAAVELRFYSPDEIAEVQEL